MSCTRHMHKMVNITSQQFAHPRFGVNLAFHVKNNSIQSSTQNYLVIATISATEKQWMNHEQVSVRVVTIEARSSVTFRS